MNAGRSRHWLATALLAGLMARAAPGQAQESEGIGHASVHEAFRALKADPRATLEVQPQWMVFTRTADDGRAETWRFTRPGHPAHPSVVRLTAGAAGQAGSRALLCESRSPGACGSLREPAPPNE